ncbi:hypothetical protein D9757_013283 [Collybiopsis confluens]|uniref:DUF6534 domain-containing protein n=1 Tax=Collybiopsis confluens TaxID=2823264 RepID=A0A8H5G6F2_9AGAR|nr:hypothetical protein D9757_013283 [Collybiopsis confluens]
MNRDQLSSLQELKTRNSQNSQNYVKAMRTAKMVIQEGPCTAHVADNGPVDLSGLFYARRMVLFSKSNYTMNFNYINFIAPVVVILALLASVSSIIAGVKTYQGQFEENLFKNDSTFEEMWLVSSVACDILITATMIFLLRASLNTGFKLNKTEKIISRLIRQLVETGFVTAAFSVADLCVFLSFPNQVYHIAICNSFSSLYSLTLLIILNGRTRISGSANSSNAMIGKLSWDVVPGTPGSISCIDSIPQFNTQNFQDGTTSIHQFNASNMVSDILNNFDNMILHKTAHLMISVAAVRFGP